MRIQKRDNQIAFENWSCMEICSADTASKLAKACLKNAAFPKKS